MTSSDPPEFSFCHTRDYSHEYILPLAIVVHAEIELNETSMATTFSRRACYAIINLREKL